MRFRSRINRLNPYAQGTVESLLKLEDENLDDGASRSSPAVAISAKRTALYRRTDDDVLVIKASTHGLGLYRRPVPDPQGWKRPWPWWVEQIWDLIICEYLMHAPAA